MNEIGDRRGAAEEALAILTRAGGELAEVFLEIDRVFRCRLEDGRVDQLSEGGERGAALRWVHGEETAFASTQDLSPDGLRAAARELVRGAQDGPNAARRLSSGVQGSALVRRPLGEVPVAERVAAAFSAERAARAAGPRVRQVTVGLSGVEQQVGIARSDGLWCTDRRVHTVLRVQAVAADRGPAQSGFEAAGGAAGWEVLDDGVPERVGRAAAERAERLLDARPAPSGPLPVVIAGEAGGTFIHEAVGHALEADLVQKELSLFRGRLGERIAAECVSVADDATRSGWRGSYACDDEGTPAQRTLLVERGVLRAYLTDLQTARRGGLPATGNGRRESYAFRPIPRMTNLLILPGDDDPAAILRSVSSGLLVVRMGGGQVNTVNGDFVFEVNEAYLIRNGERAEAVRGATLIGNAEQVLKNIDRVGSDPGQGIGTCGKDGQGVPVADAQPTIRIPEITVGGAA